MKKSVKRQDKERRSINRRASLNIRMSPQEREALEAVAKSRGVPLGDVVRDALTPTLQGAMSH